MNLSSRVTRADQPGVVRRIEGVPYYRHVVTYRTKDGKRHRFEHDSPGFPWVRVEVARRIQDVHALSFVEPGSVAIQQKREPHEER